MKICSSVQLWICMGLFLTGFVKAQEFSEVVIPTPGGYVRGQLVETEFSSFYAFTGIPYAEPPVRELRFMPPLQSQPWSGILDATEYPAACLQRDYDEAMSEDCLYLNMYVPADEKNRPESGWPILVWIHGGSLLGGTGSSYKPKHLVKHGVTVVTVNHRLGALGFLNAGVSRAAGNMGLRDILEALRWTQRSASFFNADPQSVTLAGQSSGAIAISALIISPLSEGLFHKAILESGSILGYRFFDANPQEKVSELARRLQLNVTGPEALVEELKKIDAIEFMDVSSREPDDFQHGFALYTPFVITTDSDFLEPVLPEHPRILTESGSYAKVPQLVGFNSEEGLKLLNPLAKNTQLINDIENNDNILFPNDLCVDCTASTQSDIMYRIRNYYFEGKPITENNLMDLVNLATDLWYVHPIDYWLRLQEKAGNDQPVYYYEFAFEGDFNIAKNGLGVDNVAWPGVTHGDDIGYLWDTKYTEAVEDTADEKSKQMRELMVKLWTNFVKTG